MATIRKKVNSQERYIRDGWGSGNWTASRKNLWATSWPEAKESKVDSRPREPPLPVGIHGPGWADLIPGNATSTSSTSSTSEQTEGVDSIAGRKRGRGEERTGGVMSTSNLNTTMTTSTGANGTGENHYFTRRIRGTEEVEETKHEQKEGGMNFKPESK